MKRCSQERPFIAVWVSSGKQRRVTLRERPRRTGEIDQQSVLIARRRLEADLGRRRLLVAAINDEHFRSARQLLFRHGAVDALRTLDALQLSVALRLKREGLVTVFVAADRRLCRVAMLEGSP
jgi:hypothetical protein